jgi:hypothetical protein
MHSAAPALAQFLQIPAVEREHFQQGHVLWMLTVLMQLEVCLPRHDLQLEVYLPRHDHALVQHAALAQMPPRPLYGSALQALAMAERPQLEPLAT